MLPEKEQVYEQATQKLLATIDKMKMDQLHRLRAKNLVLKFRDSFKIPAVKQAVFKPDLTDDQIARLTYHSDSFCRVASINFALMMGGTPDWQLRYINDKWSLGPHHYLMHVPSHTILDLTYDQYTHYGLDIPYHLGKAIEYDFQEDKAAQVFAKALELTPLLATLKQKD